MVCQTGVLHLGQMINFEGKEGEHVGGNGRSHVQQYLNQNVVEGVVGHIVVVCALCSKMQLFFASKS